MKSFTALVVLGLPVCFAMCGETPSVQPSKPDQGSPETGESAGDKQQLIANITYRLDGNGKVQSDTIIDGVEYGDEQKLLLVLKEKAAAAGVDGKNVSRLLVTIRADGRLPYPMVNHFMVLCVKAGISRLTFGHLSDEKKSAVEDLRTNQPSKAE